MAVISYISFLALLAFLGFATYQVIHYKYLDIIDPPTVPPSDFKISNYALLNENLRGHDLFYPLIKQTVVDYLTIKYLVQPEELKFKAIYFNKHSTKDYYFQVANLETNRSYEALVVGREIGTEILYLREINN